MIFSPGSSSTVQTCSGAHTTMGRPAPYVYTTRPSLPTAGVLWATSQSRLISTASKPVTLRTTSRLGWKSRGTSLDDFPEGGEVLLIEGNFTSGPGGGRLESPVSSARTASANGY